MHLRDRFRPATSTAGQIPWLRRISSLTVISSLRQAGLQARRYVRRNVLMAHHLAEGRKNVLFNDALNTFYLRLYGVGPYR